MLKKKLEVKMSGAYRSMIQTRLPQGANIILIILCHFDKINLYFFKRNTYKTITYLIFLKCAHTIWQNKTKSRHMLTKAANREEYHADCSYQLTDY